MGTKFKIWVRAQTACLAWLGWLDLAGLSPLPEFEFGALSVSILCPAIDRFLANGNFF